MDHSFEDLLAYVEDRLDAKARARVAAHLRRCARCRSEAFEIRRLRAGLGAVGPALGRMPARYSDVWAAVRRRLGPATSPPRFQNVRGPWQVSVSMALAAMLLASNLTLTGLRAATPDVPAIQTPAAHGAPPTDAATIEATHTLHRQASPQTPTLTPEPVATS